MARVSALDSEAHCGMFSVTGSSNKSVGAAIVCFLPSVFSSFFLFCVETTCTIVVYVVLVQVLEKTKAFVYKKQ
jgi:hypothetical protein